VSGGLPLNETWRLARCISHPIRHMVVAYFSVFLLRGRSKSAIGIPPVLKARGGACGRCIGLMRICSADPVDC
jgi:hypothetical protein